MSALEEHQGRSKDGHIGFCMVQISSLYTGSTYLGLQKIGKISHVRILEMKGVMKLPLAEEQYCQHVRH